MDFSALKELERQIAIILDREKKASHLEGYEEGYDAAYTLAYNKGLEEGQKEVYNRRYKEGYDEGYFKGYKALQVERYQEDYDRGYKEGCDNTLKGYKQTCEEIYTKGCKFGYTQGKEEGYTKGHKEGYKEGCRDTNEKLRPLLIIEDKIKNGAKDYETIIMFRDLYLIPSPGTEIGSRELLNRYIKWCQSNGLDKVAMVTSDKKWGTLILNHRIFRRERKMNGTIICGYALPPE